MKELIKLEYRKIWNKSTIAAVVALFMLSTLHTIIYLNRQDRTIDKDGKLVTGMASYRALKEASKDIEGVMDQNYIQTLIKKYNASQDKKYLEKHRGYMGTGGMTKYMFPNYLINFAYYRQYMSNGNENMSLDYPFLDSEQHFYQKFKEAVKEQELFVRETIHEEHPRLAPALTKDQLHILDKKIKQVKTPFYIAYIAGFYNIRSWIEMEHNIFFIVLVFGLAGILAKDSIGGMDELGMATLYGRKKNIKARLIAGSLFTVTAYLIFIGTIVIEHGMIASLHGWNAAIQTFWNESLLNVNVGTAMLIKIIGGLLGALVIANLVMLFSMQWKNMKFAIILSFGVIWICIRLALIFKDYWVGVLPPVNFQTDKLISAYFFFGKIAMPYYILILIVASVYFGLIFFFMRRACQKYYLN